MAEPDLLAIRGLHTSFFTPEGEVRAVDGVELTVGPGELVGLVGESGSGKTVTALSVLCLVDEPGRVVAGSIRFGGVELRSLSRARMREFRGDRIGMIFQQPISSLNPSYRVGYQIGEVYEAHRQMKRAVGEERAREMLNRVGIPDAAHRARSYPHQVSGGQAQRVMIAMAPAGEPELLVADEPISALDVSIQSQILNLLSDLQARLELTLLFVAHDLAVVEHLCDRVAVMYLGRIVEIGTRDEVFDNPEHPYTEALLSAIPVADPERERDRRRPKGELPSPLNPPAGCHFHARCPLAVEGICDVEVPTLLGGPDDPAHLAACHLRTGAHQDLLPSREGRR